MRVANVPDEYNTERFPDGKTLYLQLKVWGKHV